MMIKFVVFYANYIDAVLHSNDTNAINTSITIEEISCAILWITRRRAKKFFVTFIFIGALLKALSYFQYHHAKLIIGIRDP